MAGLAPSNGHRLTAYLLGNTEAQFGDASHRWAHEGEAGRPWMPLPCWHIVKGEALQLGELAQVLVLVKERHRDVELGQLCHAL